MSFVDFAVILETALAPRWPGYESVVTYPVPKGPSAVLIAYELEGVRALVVREMEQTTAFEKEGALYVAQLTGAGDWDAALAALVDAPPSKGWIATELSLDVETPELVVFSAIFAGSSIDDPEELEVMEELGAGDPIRISLAPGRYRVEEIPRHTRGDAEWYLARLVRS